MTRKEDNATTKTREILLKIIKKTTNSSQSVFNLIANIEVLLCF